MRLSPDRTTSRLELQVFYSVPTLARIGRVSTDKMRLLLPSLALLALASCGGELGQVVRRDGAVLTGKLWVDPCRDGVVGFVDGRSGDRAQLPLSELRRVDVGAQTYDVLDGRDVQDVRFAPTRGEGPILARVVERGPATLYEQCQVAYGSTALREKEYTLQLWIVRVEGVGTFQVPLEPKDFQRVADTMFAGDTALLQEIHAARYARPIDNPEPGRVTSIEALTLEQLLHFVRAHSAWMTRK